MSFINKPKVRHPDLPKNELGLTRRDYEGGMSTLCAGCGHDTVTASIIEAIWDLGIRPEQLVKLSGIGCSSKTTAYFASGAHGFNGVHGRMPSVATGANAANKNLYYIGVSGDGDSLSIGFGQFAHAIRRNVNMLYICENNGVYGLTKGQFSASADIGSKTKKGEENLQAPVDPVLAALSLGGSFIARSFSGDRAQLIPLIKAGLMHKGFALIDVISPCVTFNDHEGSTKSYAFTREHYEPAVNADYIPPQREIHVDYAEGEVAAGRDARRQPAAAPQARAGLRPDAPRQGVQLSARPATRGRARHRAHLHLAQPARDARDERDGRRAVECGAVREAAAGGGGAGEDPASATRDALDRPDPWRQLARGSLTVPIATTPASPIWVIPPYGGCIWTESMV